MGGNVKWFNLLLILSFLIFPCYGEDMDIQAIIAIESNGNPNAYNSKSGCIGLMGINPKGALADWNDNFENCRKNYILSNGGMCWGDECQGYSYPNELGIKAEKECKKFNIGDLYNPTINVKIGTWYINERIPEMLKTYGLKDTVEARLACYNAGIGVYKAYKEGKRKLPKETRDYIKKYHKLTEK